MELTFLGTRGEIDIASPRHRRHSALLVCQKGARWRRRSGPPCTLAYPPVAGGELGKVATRQHDRVPSLTPVGLTDFEGSLIRLSTSVLATSFTEDSGFTVMTGA